MAKLLKMGKDLRGRSYPECKLLDKNYRIKKVMGQAISDMK